MDLVDVKGENQKIFGLQKWHELCLYSPPPRLGMHPQNSISYLVFYSIPIRDYPSVVVE